MPRRTPLGGYAALTNQGGAPMLRAILSLAAMLLLSLSPAQSQQPAHPAAQPSAVPPERLRGIWMIDVDAMLADPALKNDKGAGWLGMVPIWEFSDDGVTIWTLGGASHARAVKYTPEENGDITLEWGSAAQPKSIRMVLRDATHLGMLGVMSWAPDQPVPFRRLLGPGERTPEILQQGEKALAALEGQWRADAQAFRNSAWIKRLAEDQRGLELQEYGRVGFWLRQNRIFYDMAGAGAYQVLGCTAEGEVVVSAAIEQEFREPNDPTMQVLWILRPTDDGLVWITDAGFRDIPFRRVAAEKPPK